MAENNPQKEVIQQDRSDLPMPQKALVSDGINAGGSRQFATGRGPKREWPEVVGLPVEEAKEKIKEDMPTARFQVVLPDCFVTMDFDTGRVRLYVDPSNRIARTPKTG